MHDKTKIYAIQITTYLLAYKYMNYSYCQTDREKGRVRERKKRRERKKGRKTIDIYTCT